LLCARCFARRLRGRRVAARNRPDVGRRVGAVGGTRCALARRPRRRSRGSAERTPAGAGPGRCVGLTMGDLSTQQQTVALFAGVGVVLVVASLVALALKHWLVHGQPHAVIDNLNVRIKAWWVMVLVIGVAFLAGRVGVTLLFLFVSYAALREFL